MRGSWRCWLSCLFCSLAVVALCLSEGTNEFSIVASFGV